MKTTYWNTRHGVHIHEGVKKHSLLLASDTAHTFWFGKVKNDLNFKFIQIWFLPNKFTIKTPNTISIKPTIVEMLGI